MRFGFLTVLAIAVFTRAAMSQDVLTSLDNGNDAKPWQAVGRLNINGNGFCTGALIAPKLVLTAAHCLFDKKTKKRMDGAKIEFLAGWLNGRAEAYRDVRRAVLHPEYDYDGVPNSERVRNDLALLELERPINNASIEPFDIAARPAIGDRVSVVSYAQHRAETPSLQKICKVLSRQEGILVTSCDVDFGASGAPIFVLNGNEAQIVSVVSARAELGEQTVALGTALRQPLSELRAALSEGNVMPLGGNAHGVRVRVGGNARKTGAKFVKP